MLPRLIGFIFILGIQSLAGEDFMPSSEVLAEATQQAQKIQNETNMQIKEYLRQNLFEKQHPKKCCPSQQLDEQKKDGKGCIKNTDPHPPQKDNRTQILIFVSFSMPESSLKSLSQEAIQNKAVLVMRGLHQDSFVKTAQKLQNLEITIDINPELFDTHHITSVPTFVLVKNGHPVSKLKGNVTLEFAAKKFENQLVENQFVEVQQFEVVP